MIFSFQNPADQDDGLGAFTMVTGKKHSRQQSVMDIPRKKPRYDEHAHDVVTLLSTVPGRNDPFIPPGDRTWFYRNDSRLKGSREKHIDFKILDDEIVPSMDATGLALPTLISTLLDFRALGQDMMWCEWYHRKLFSKMYVRQGDHKLSVTADFGPLVCSHFLVRHMSTVGKRAYVCMWCSYNTSMPSAWYMFMLRLPCAYIVKHDMEFTKLLSQFFTIPSDKFGNWPDNCHHPASLRL